MPFHPSGRSEDPQNAADNPTDEAADSGQSGSYQETEINSQATAEKKGQEKGEE